MLRRQGPGAVDVFYNSTKIARVFQSAALLRKAYGADNAARIRRRLFVLEAVECLGHVPRVRPERCHPLDGRLDGCFAVDVLHPFRIVFAPADANGRRKSLNARAWQKATAVTILDVLDYH